MNKNMVESKGQENTLVIDIRLTRGLIAALIAVLLVMAGAGYLALGQQAVSAGPAGAYHPGAKPGRQRSRHYQNQQRLDGDHDQ
jgi:hypothetical protein